MVTYVDDTGAFGWVKWHIDHKTDCTELYDEESSEFDAEDAAGWEFMPEPFTFQGKQYYPLKSRANIGHVLNAEGLLSACL